jgi:G6PDH family F420-dependent oxidoreductase
MPDIGYALSSEEHGPNDLVRNAQRAEESGFRFALISDHYHPWVSAQGHSPFVWSVIGGIAQATDALRLGTGVTCPIMRIHPAAMMPGRFFLGVGTGENLNEHVLGIRWPPFDVRLDMFEEAIEIIRLLWEGENVSYWGEFYTVEDARLFTVPDSPPPLYVAASGEVMAEAAGELGDGFITTSPKKELVQAYGSGGGEGPRIGQLTVCWAPTKEEAIETVYKIWPNSGLPGELSAELRTVEHFEQAVKLVTKEQASKDMPVGPNAQEHIDGIQKYLDAGFDQVYIHQIGHEQEGFFQFYAQEVLPSFHN